MEWEWRELLCVHPTRGVVTEQSSGDEGTGSVPAWIDAAQGQEEVSRYAPPFSSRCAAVDPRAAFNMLGVIHTVERDSQNIVEIDFHDRGLRTGSHFSDHFQFTIAALGTFLPVPPTRH